MKTFLITMNIRDDEGYQIASGRVEMSGETAFEAMDNLQRLLDPEQVAKLPGQELCKIEHDERNILAEKILFELIGQIQTRDPKLIKPGHKYTLTDPDLIEVTTPAKVAMRIATAMILERRKS